MGGTIVHALLAAIVALVVTWLLLLVTLVVNKPSSTTAKDALLLAPDCLRLLRGLATDRSVSLGTRLTMWLLIGYLACPIDLVPDFLPVIGYADDIIIVAIALRSVVRRTGIETLERHWPGTPEGFDTLLRIAGMKD